MATVIGTNVSLGYSGETVGSPGTTVSSSLTAFRANSRNVNLKKALIESAEVRTTRQRGDVRHGFNSVEGDITCELALAAYDDPILWALGGTTNSSPTADPVWAAPTTLTATAGITASLSGSNLVLTRTTGTFNFIDNAYRPGDWCTLANLDAANNGVFRLVTVAAAALTFAPDGQTTFVANGTPNDAAGIVTYRGKKAIINGVQGSRLKPFTLERSFFDGANPVYEVYRGCCISRMTWSFRPEGLAIVTFGILGMSATLSTSPLDASYDASPTTAAGSPPMAAIDATVYIGNSSINATAFEFTLDNQRSLLAVLGTKISRGVFEGQAKVTGSFTRLVSNESTQSNFQDETLVDQITVRINELGSSEFFSVTFYKCKFTIADIDPPASGPVVQQVNFEALETTYTGSTLAFKDLMHIQRSTTT